MTVTPSSFRPASIADQPPFGSPAAPENPQLLFETLLKSFDNQHDLNDDAQDAITPRIGLSADSFLEAALPAHTALPLGSSPIYPDPTKRISTAIDHFVPPP